MKHTVKNNSKESHAKHTLSTHTYLHIYTKTKPSNTKNTDTLTTRTLSTHIQEANIQTHTLYPQHIH